MGAGGAKRVLVTGGAGFVGANLSLGLSRRHPDWELVALDNLHRRGSELNLPRLEDAGIEFVRADVREPAQLSELGRVDALIECSAEPSALAGMDGGEGSYAFHTNLVGAYNCLELARRDGAQLLFLSTSRVYPHDLLNGLALEEGETRFELAAEQQVQGVSEAGISEGFPLEGPRTLYGATKLAAELLITEYADAFGLSAVVNRCGVIAGPLQMGRVDQGVFSLWMLHHHFGIPLSYIGYGAEGKQVRDLVHIDDLLELVDEQLGDAERWAGIVANVGGGRERSLSLLETTAICRELTGNEVEIAAEPTGRHGDVPLYVSDCARLEELSDWRPRRGAREVMEDIHSWIVEDGERVANALGLAGRGEG
ncbi:MAG: NAD-dependent epimerase/dehydratase family protein [Solirubrobacterales bacterium]|nr:NAD-dependent epimerase/dehydratase family protein [Solirubrobacterales bacterium]